VYTAYDYHCTSKYLAMAHKAVYNTQASISWCRCWHLHP